MTGVMEVPLPPNGADGVWYFAYGSNMNPTTLTGRRKVAPTTSFPAVLQGWALSFRMLGLPYAEPGFATIERAAGSQAAASTSGRGSPPSGSAAVAAAGSRWCSEVHGVLHRVSLAEWTNIMTTEGVGGGWTGYRVVEVDVDLYDGRRVTALTLEGQGPSLHRPARPVAPSRRYLDLIRGGARHHGLHPDYVAHLDSLQPYEVADWTAAVGRAVALAAVLPLALPLVPPVLMLRVARKRAAEATTDGSGARGDGAAASQGVNGTTKGGGVAAVVTAAKEASDLPSKGAAVAAAAVRVSAPTAVESLAGGDSGGDGPGRPGRQLPTELTRPPLVLPGALGLYLAGVQNFAWALHDYVAAPLFGSGSMGNGGSSRSNGGRNHDGASVKGRTTP